MEGRRPLDASCGSGTDHARVTLLGIDSHFQRSQFYRTLHTATAIAKPTRFEAMKYQLKPRHLGAVLCTCLNLLVPVALAQSPSLQQVQQLASAQRWDEIVRLASPLSSRSADMDFYYGSALAHLGRFDEAESTLQSGRRLAPRDARFPIELAGIAFKKKRYSRAVPHLRQALKMSPNDPYANDFLGTVYFLVNNLPAALKYWNRIDKPAIDVVSLDPVPQMSPALLDRAFAISPGAILKLPQLLDTDARVRGLGIFPHYQFDLRALDDGKFDAVFRSQELNGFGDGRLESLVLFLHELPFQAVTPGYFNLLHQSVNLTSLVRWDPQKRRIFAELSGPFEHSGKFRYELVADFRNENWALRNGFTGPAPTLASLNLRRELATFDLASFASDRLRWKLGAELSNRGYRSVVAGGVLTSDLLAAGFQLKQHAQVAGTLFRIPDRRFALNGEASSEAARLWSQPRESFEKLQGSLGWLWSPHAEGDDYQMQQRIRAGETFGQVPFDELFMLGLERDNELPLRAHIGTRDGRKGSAPIGRNYFLHSWEVDKNLFSNGLMTVKVGPLLDIGNITNPGAALGSRKWLFDTGAQVKLRVFTTTVVFSYGRDLRSGSNAFYVSLLQ
jgi:tetratricopeptide (TPR) repeat protein